MSSLYELPTSSDSCQFFQMEFMIETIFDIKNNKKRSKEETVQHTRIKKWLQKVHVFISHNYYCMFVDSSCSSY